MTIELIPTVVATAQALVALPPPVILPEPGSVSMPEWIIELIKFIASGKGLGLGGAVIALCQLILKGLSTTYLAEKAGKWKLLALYVVATLGTVLGFVISGVPVVGALLAGPSLAMLQNALNQIWLQFVVKKNERS